MMTRLALAAICLTAPLAFHTAQAETLIDGSDPEAIRQIASGYGSATLGTDPDGDPEITGRIEGTRYQVLFYGCTDGKGCKSIQLVAGWTDSPVELTALNAWNADRRFGKAYLDLDGDPAIEMNVNLDFGVTARNLDDTFDYWRYVLSDFQAEVFD